ncbi:MAG: N-acetylmuramoyl-L-alanine amidase [Rhodospirillaceae bacterium]|nr:N-acetylmuramoyl-L-alanine amidase [Rhodospirillaceae bacterium]
MVTVVERPSPNFNERPVGGTIDLLILHYTGMLSAAAALERLCEPEAKVSAHYTIDEDGTIYRHVAEDKRAWHAGVSCWAGTRDINDRSIGIELVNPGHEFGYRPFPEAQIAALIDLGREIVARHRIPARRVLGHSDVAPRRKTDPGELFPWPRLAAAGLGLWVARPRLDNSRAIQVPEIQADLAAIGYDCPRDGVLDEGTRAAVAAFQRHFRPAAVTGIPDGETAALAVLIRHAAP